VWNSGAERVEEDVGEGEGEKEGEGEGVGVGVGESEGDGEGEGDGNGDGEGRRTSPAKLSRPGTAGISGVLWTPEHTATASNCCVTGLPDTRNVTLYPPSDGDRGVNLDGLQTEGDGGRQREFAAAYV
jgi:hypothetical protein